VSVEAVQAGDPIAGCRLAAAFPDLPRHALSEWAGGPGHPEEERTLPALQLMCRSSRHCCCYQNLRSWC
jgi:hypothetical protein